MTDTPPLHSSIIAMVSLASGIAANHPAMGQCQLRRLREMGVAEEHIATVIEIARHIRDEAAQKLDAAFDEAAAAALAEMAQAADQAGQGSTQESCACSTTASGQKCC